MINDSLEKFSIPCVDIRYLLVHDSSGKRQLGEGGEKECPERPPTPLPPSRKSCMKPCLLLCTKRKGLVK